MRHAPFAFALLLLGGAVSALPINLKDDSWDFLLLVQSWPQSTCTTGGGHQCEIPSDVSGFVLHGLWPSRNDTSYPSNCPGPSFSESKIQDIEGEMQKDWPNLYVDSGKTSFWAHEWEKHGTCASNVPQLNSEHNFFAKTLDLYNQYSYTQALAKAGIVPSSDKSYPTSEFISAFRSAFGADPLLDCYYSKATGQILTQIGMCVSPYTFQVYNCNDATYGKGSCDSSDNIYLPPIQH